MSASVAVVAVVCAIFVCLVLGVAALFARFLHTPAQDEALLITTPQGPRVILDRTHLAVPFLHRVERMDLSVCALTLDCSGSRGIVCKDCVRINVHLHLNLAVTRDPESIVRVAQTVGCSKATDPNTLRELFDATCLDLIKTFAKRTNFDDLERNPATLRDHLITELSKDLHGYTLVDVVVSDVHHTPLEQLDPNNILDARGMDVLAKRYARSKTYIESL